VSAAATPAVAAGYRPFITLDSAGPTLGGYDSGDPFARTLEGTRPKQTMRIRARISHVIPAPLFIGRCR
jgi:hypothetical protein